MHPKELPIRGDLILVKRLMLEILVNSIGPGRLVYGEESVVLGMEVECAYYANNGEELNSFYN